MDALLNGIKDWSVMTVDAWGYPGIFVLMVLEAIIFLIPSEVVMPVAGLAAAEGKFDFVIVGIVGTLGSLAGAWIFYGVGALGGRPLLMRYGKWLLLRPEDIERSEAWFDKHGNAAVLVSRLVPVVRTLISVPAGVARMPFARFSLYTFLGALPWTFGLAATGFLLGERWEEFIRFIDPITYVTAAGVLALVGVWYFRRLRARRSTG